MYFPSSLTEKRLWTTRVGAQAITQSNLGLVDGELSKERGKVSRNKNPTR